MRGKTHTQDVTPQTDTTPASLRHPQMGTHMLSEPTITHSETHLLVTTRMVRIRLRMTLVVLGCCSNIPTPQLLQHNCWLCELALRTGPGTGLLTSRPLSPKHVCCQPPSQAQKDQRVPPFLTRPQKGSQVQSHPYQVQKGRQQERDGDPILHMGKLRPSMKKQLVHSHASGEKPS